MNIGIIPFHMKRMPNNKVLITNRFGGWGIFDEDDALQILAYNVKDSGLKGRLLSANLAVSRENIAPFVNRFRNLNGHLFHSVGLHIAVVTTRCNSSCAYCQAQCPSPVDMDEETAAYVLKFILDTPAKDITLEFQGGEPLLNFDAVKFMTEKVRQWKADDGRVDLAIVTNGILVDEKIADFLKDNGFSVCISYDGIDDINDRYRRIPNGRHSEYAKRAYRLLKDRGVEISFISTIVPEAYSRYKDLIDNLLSLGERSIALRPVSPFARGFDFDAERYRAFYKKAVEYIIQLNKQGNFLMETYLYLAARKVLLGEDPGYVDMTNPCGAARSVLAYGPKGEIYPCDEGRMQPADEVCRLGNVRTSAFKEVVGGREASYLLESSLLDLADPGNPYMAFTGRCPVYSLVENGTTIGPCRMQIVNEAALEALFELLQENEDVIKRWLKGGENGREKAL